VTLPPLSPDAWLYWDFVARLLPEEGYAALEVGCGHGGFGARLAQLYRYVGLEPDRDSYRIACDQLASAGGDSEVRNGDLSALRPAETFDLICAFEVIEHLEHDDKAVAEWAGRLRPGGWLILSAPAFQHRYGPADVVAGRHRRYDPAILCRLLREAGLDNVEVWQLGGPLGYALEASRNHLGRRLLDRSDMSRLHSDAGLSPARGLGPARHTAHVAGLAARVGTLPFRMLQRRFPDHGPGLVARAQLSA
jgi:SAM-dependent methyltransferase